MTSGTPHVDYSSADGSMSLDNSRRLSEELKESSRGNDRQPISKCLVLGSIAGGAILLTLIALCIAGMMEYSYHRRPTHERPDYVRYQGPPGPPMMPPPQQSHAPLRLEMLNDIPMDRFEMLSWLNIAWGPDEYGDARQYTYKIESASRNLDKQTTTVNLSSGHTLTVAGGIAVLTDDEGQTLGVYKSPKVQREEREELAEMEEEIIGEEGLEDLAAPTGPELRMLKKKKVRREEITPGMLSAGAYCAYGCGTIGLQTFPNYYRPFYGYGYPLVGIAEMFEPGYGGNPVTELQANGLLDGRTTVLGGGVV